MLMDQCSNHCLHHAYVYGFNKVLLLVGNNNTEILYGLFVTISNDLIDAYGNVLKDIYRNMLEWIHATTGESMIPLWKSIAFRWTLLFGKMSTAICSFRCLIWLAFCN